MLSMKQAARRPRPPLPRAASGSISRSASRLDAELGQGGAHRFEQVEIVQAVDQQAADQEFEGEVIDPLALVRVGRAGGLHPAVDDAVAHGECGGDEPVPVGGDERVLADGIGELGDDGAAQGRHILVLHRQCKAGYDRVGRRWPGLAHHVVLIPQCTKTRFWLGALVAGRQAKMRPESVQTARATPSWPGSAAPSRPNSPMRMPCTAAKPKV